MLNAGIGLFIADKAKSIGAGIQTARQAIESGHAYDKLNEVIKNNRGRTMTILDDIVAVKEELLAYPKEEQLITRNRRILKADLPRTASLKAK